MARLRNPPPGVVSTRQATFGDIGTIETPDANTVVFKMKSVNAAMLEHVPRFVDVDRPDKSRVMVRTPSGSELDVIDPELAASLGDGVRAIKQDRGVFDAMPLSLITTESIAQLSALVGYELVPQRFRPNLLVESDEREDAWVGHELRIGGMAMRERSRRGFSSASVRPNSARLLALVVKRP